MRGIFAPLGSLGLLMAGSAAAAPLTLRSPDGRIELRVETDAAGQPRYTVLRDDRVLIAPSALGLRFEAYAKLGPGMAVTADSRRSGTDAYTLPAAKVSRVRDRFNELSVDLAETAGAGRRLGVVFRAYDDGVAFRYRLPAQPAFTRLRLAGEMSEFAFPADYACQALNLGRYGSSHEGEYDPVRASAFRPHHLYELPVLCRADATGPAIAIAEADLRDYAGLYLAGRETGDLGLEARLSPRLDEPTIAVKRDVGADGVLSPWRVVMIADEPGKLIESTLVTSLSPPADGRFDWVRPGKTAWDWWSGPTLNAVPEAGMNDATMRAFIDFAGAQRLEYMLIDDGWYRNSGAGGRVLAGADNLTAIPRIDLPALVAYGAERKVGLWVWVHWKLLDANMDRALPLYARLGVKGIKVDFMDRDDQDMVAFYHRLLKTAADNRLMVDLHGAYRPTGLIRTYPNYLTQEGVLGAEYNKWTRRITARHNVTLPFTRGLLGPYDYTPGGWRNATPQDFRISVNGPMVQTTRGHGLAMYVVFDSPFVSLADSPDAYAGQPGLDFLRAVPTTWDETRFIAGSVGEHIVLARRKGREWYVGAMTNEAGRKIRLPLDFLGKGRFDATSWIDGAGPTELDTLEQRVTAKDVLPLALAPSGGAAVRLVPAR